MDKSDKTLLAPKIGLYTALIVMATTVIDKFSGFITGGIQTNAAPGTNSAGTNAVGTNAAADPKFAVTGNTGHIEKFSEATDGLVMPWHLVIVILSLLAALLFILIWRKIKRKKMSEDQIAA